ncbi:LysR family transcriptional regulator [Streptomyces mobaraensis NBRC 13819 = DSM 40847]|uniref:LysR family transcriptional regulator n=1 Tax=Streptomyces mobaraensis (strain ATCC 29032 / DSM 40847 / JCM 4168 / NBRC 13819 / NCIMB 11159 / IPCR 16-22) TaxID=1223523 RepID=M3C7E4_STRM1|nr:LysR family transcriptional regulator [Streptomyces mobaraensis]EME99880.1 LysR family transcriptional regulator [Streptomyces mobaraensis NBRC 13819 = DSM 40847]QTT72236.1 LysR family transcriptional regulator [Streptomyces mobaraensis NBRC 13819 = DSM 40847]
MDVRQLEYFLAVVDRGGFGRAASALYVSQPSLSQAVRALERDVGAELFHRIGRRVVLTEAGRALIDPARAAVRSLEAARASVASVRELRSGRLDIAAMPSQAIEPLTTLMRSYAERYPGVVVTVGAAFTARDVVEAVRTGAVELGLLATAGAVPDAEVRSRVLGEQRFVLLAPPGGPFAGRDRVRCEELAGRRLIVGRPGTGMRAYVDSLRDRGVDFTVTAETEHRVALLPLVLAGVGLAVVTEAWRDVARRTGAEVLDIEPAAALRVFLVSRRGVLSPAAAAFWSAATPTPTDG